MSTTEIVKEAESRHDFALIANWIQPQSKVLDLGCGNGSLLSFLREKLGVKGYGVDKDDDNVLACIGHGVNVIQMDLEAGLAGFDSLSFDYVILSQTLQAMVNTEGVLREMLRVGKQGIITFPNFGYWRHRIQLMAGHMPVSDNIPHQWYNTPNLHLCTIDDFEALCDKMNIRITDRIVINEGNTVSFMPNLFGSLAIYRFEQAAWPVSY
ncbi:MULTISPECIES: methionine biosynthesis protein MetW [Methylobacillus]|uniref:Methionine biosynthesis MetW n=1 Tax=Methylobacillus flagellatus (strain ATCC 51484 / DSM 6875 / VKM B-1610 / KT) TaxID=265072 RepID=Q1GYE1_METFK|nr:MULTISPECIES: methionine biosynthesis protein MetW [Methylobacillus]ABE50746.1 Methionine biosynthesis MetW [Methylobacillus flagellatus KT]MPS47651.1 methionine biosynthesis protein MetW [Methylobacillus sp.]